MAEVVEIGSLLFDGEPVEPGAMYDKGIITLGDTVPGKGIRFIKWQDLYVADRCVCVNVSWNDLDKQGFIFGWPTKLNGVPYLCRSLKMGKEKRFPNEWDAMLDDLGEDNKLWHWKDQFFWGQEVIIDYMNTHGYGVIRGSVSARHWRGNYVDDRSLITGFRPVLEPLQPEPPVTDALIGRDIQIYGADGFVTGRLVSYSDYDLELAATGPLPERCSWLGQVKNSVFVDRELVTYLCEEG